METSINNYITELNTGILVLDESLKTQYLNPSAQSILDTSLSASHNKELKELFYEEPDNYENFLDCLNQRREFAKIDALLFLKGGKKLFCDYHIKPFSNEYYGEGLILEILNKEYSSQIKERLRTQTNQEVTSAFIRGLAHEIKNPLSGIRGSAQLLSQKLSDNGLKEYTQVIISETDRLTSLVDNILGPNRKPAFESQNIHLVLENVISLTKQDLIDKKIYLSKDYDPSIPDISLDVYLLEQCILNLVNNSKEALIEADVLSPEIKLVTRIIHQEILDDGPKKTVCKISVIDNGPGIPEDLKDSIFFPMISSKVNGSGLGLSITQGIVSQHNGTISYESERGKTEFSILIPLGVESNN